MAASTEIIRLVIMVKLIIAAAALFAAGIVNSATFAQNSGPSGTGADTQSEGKQQKSNTQHPNDRTK